MQNEKVQIRPMKQEDLPRILKRFSFPWFTPDKIHAKWSTYLLQHQEKIRTVFLIENTKELIGYGSLLRISEYDSFKKERTPEIHDLWIADEYRLQGYGKMLLNHIEKIAKEEGCQKIGIGVGLYKDYGPAQILYTKLRYVPDGNGIAYNGIPVTPGQSYLVDDDLILYMTKNLS